MDYISLYRKYRPQTFAEVIGQENIVDISIANKKFSYWVDHMRRNILELCLKELEDIRIKTISMMMLYLKWN